MTLKPQVAPEEAADVAARRDPRTLAKLEALAEALLGYSEAAAMPSPVSVACDAAAAGTPVLR